MFIVMFGRMQLEKQSSKTIKINEILEKHACFLLKSNNCVVSVAKSCFFFLRCSS